MTEARNAHSVTLEIERADRPFSSFGYIEKRFGDYPPIRRLFSQARTSDMESIIIEKIPETGMVSLENEEIRMLYPDYSMLDLVRVTFWKVCIPTEEAISGLESASLLGYAVLKRDQVPSKGVDSWHVFESVSRKTPYEHTYVPAGRVYKVRVGDREFDMTGVLYCQQNRLNKACAQVALRSLCALHKPQADISTTEINALARSVTGQFDPAQGLSVKQIRAVLDGLGIRYTDIVYSELLEEERQGLDYQKFLYSGIESGAGALLGFKLTGPEASGHHIIPFIGHTFNRDAWVPNADSAYFHVGEDTKYISSE